MVYRVNIVGNTGTVVGSVALTDAQQIYSFWLHDNTLIGADGRGNYIGYWKYPAGGSPFNTIIGIYEPLGLTLSLATRHK